MTLPPRLEAKFMELVNRYPTKRSALVPMLLYAQDAMGHISDEMIAEIARRLDLNTLQVTETLVYYSMLRRKPAGKYHVRSEERRVGKECRTRRTQGYWREKSIMI